VYENGSQFLLIKPKDGGAGGIFGQIIGKEDFKIIAKNTKTGE